MAITRVGVLNMALRHLGEPPMVGPDAVSTWEKRVDRAHDQEVEALLEGHSWNFAQLVQALGASEPAPVGWEYGHNKPGDWLRTVLVNMTGDKRDDGIPFEDIGGRICCNQPNPYLRYVSRNALNSPGGWPMVFAKAAAAAIAYSVAPVTTQGESVRDRIERDAAKLLRDAKSHDAQGQPAWDAGPGRWASARVRRISGYRNDGEG